MKTALAASLLCAGVLAQTPKTQFEVASIHATTVDTAVKDGVTAGIRIDGAQFRALLPLRALIVIAYKAPPHQLEAPDWMSTQWYEIRATFPEGHAKMSEAPGMLEDLLARRFNMKTHRVTKDLPIYTLTLSKGGISAKEDPLDPLEQSVEAVATSSETSSVTRFPRGAAITMGSDRIEAKKFTMAMLAQQMTPFVDRPIVDQTGLPADAAYDLILELTHEDFLATRVQSALTAGMTVPPQAMKLLESAGDSLHTALAKVGLKLEAKKAPMEVLVVDSAEKTPSEN
jgi:uncharacterized protein (TIGR03435 family)